MTMTAIITKERIWLTVLSVLIALGIAGGAVAVASLRADLDLLDRQIAGEIESDWSGGSDGTGGWGQQPTAQPAGNPSGRVDGMSDLSDTFGVTVTVRLSGPADLLFEPPLLEGEKATYHPTRKSLEQARFDFLSLVTGGEATAAFVFRPSPAQNEKLTLVFNPNHQAADPVAPRWEMAIRAGE